MKDQDIIYHYTSVEAFMSIIQSQSLWVSSITEMNDSQEGKLLPPLIRRAIESVHLSAEETIRCMEKYHSKDPLTQHLRVIPNIESNPEFIEGMRDLTKRTLVELILPSLEIVSNMLLPHICCFSKNGDKLSQWRAYGDDGKGVALAFSKIELEKSIKNKSEFPKYINDVIYNNLDQDEYCAKLIKELIEQSIFRSKKVDPVKERFVSSNFFAAPVLFKSEGFSEEDEVRLVYNSNDEMKSKYRTVNGNIISFYEHVFRPSCLKGIILGPKCNLQTDTLDFKRFLGSGYNHLLQSIKKSEVSYK